MSTVVAGKDVIQLDRMDQLTEAVKMDDVWTGKTDPAARRKRQNRLNQRAYRKRKLLELEANDDTVAVYTTSHPANFRYQLVDYGQLGFARPPSSLPRTRPMMPYASANQPAMIFPLPADHLLTLIQYNVLRAIVTNMTIVPMVQRIPVECRAVLDVAPMVIPHDADVPPNFALTHMQRTTPHEYWVDMFPSAQFRDNMIVALQDSRFDEDDWHMDIVGGLWEGFADVERRGIVAWSDPWSPNGWEVSEGFLKKWGYLLKGCRDMLDATNKWRALRDEAPLVWEV